MRPQSMYPRHREHFLCDHLPNRCLLRSFGEHCAIPTYRHHSNPSRFGQHQMHRFRMPMLRGVQVALCGQCVYKT